MSGKKKDRLSMINALPSSAVLHLSKPYVAGYSMRSALDQAHKLYETRGILSTIDVLGEDAHEQAQVDINIQTYANLVRTIDEEWGAEGRPTVSFKPSSFVVSKEGADGTIVLDRDVCYNNIAHFAQMGIDHNVNQSIDMEDHRWTDVTLDIYQDLIQNFNNMGTVLQARLHRTVDDIKRFSDEDNARFRMCIGIYNEPADIALQKKPEMKDRMFDDVKQLFTDGHYVEIATHDRDLIKRIFAEIIIPQGITPDRFEVQNLLGVPRDRLQDSLVNGSYMEYHHSVTTRLYVPFSLSKQDAVAYCRRRLGENPEIQLHGAVNFIGRGIDRLRGLFKLKG